MIIPKISIFHDKNVYFEKNPCENRPERLWFMGHHNAPVNDATYWLKKKSPDWCKKCYATENYEMAL